MALDSDGKLDGKTPIFNDVLSFMWNKMSRCAGDPLVKACNDFYEIEAIRQARNLLFATVPEIPGGKRRVKNVGGVDILCSLYLEFKKCSAVSEFIFVAKNLNNLPIIDLASIDGATIVHQQASMNRTLAQLLTQYKEVTQEIAIMKSSMVVKQHVTVNATNRSSQAAAQRIPDVTQGGTHPAGNPSQTSNPPSVEDSYAQRTTRRSRASQANPGSSSGWIEHRE